MHKLFEWSCNLLSKVVASKPFVPGCLFLAALIRLLWIWLINTEQVSDFMWYYQFALNIAEGRGYSVAGVPTGYWPIGYPGLLGILFYLAGASVLVGKLLNIVLYLGTIFLTYRLSQKLFQSECAARITLCLLCFYPNHIAYTALLSSEILFVFLVASSALLFASAGERTDLLLLSGVLWGLATLTKPQAILLPFLFLIFFSRNARSFIRASLLVYCMLLLTISPWLIRNYQVFGSFTLAHTAGINLLDGNNPYATGNHNFDDNVNALLGDLRTSPLEYMFDGKEVERDIRAKSIAMNYIVHNPGRTLSLWPKKFAGLFVSDVDGFYYSMGRMQGLAGQIKVLYIACRIFGELYYVFLIGLFAIALPIALKMPIRPHHVGVAVILSLTLVYLILFGNARYHFPMMPWVAIYSGIGAQVLFFGRKPFPAFSTAH
jgi:hypothetical protein